MKLQMIYISKEEFNFNNMDKEKLKVIKEKMKEVYPEIRLREVKE